jgi:hypothetical protein
MKNLTFCATELRILAKIQWFLQFNNKNYAKNGCSVAKREAKLRVKNQNLRDFEAELRFAL